MNPNPVEKTRKIPINSVGFEPGIFFSLPQRRDTILISRRGKWTYFLSLLVVSLLIPQKSTPNPIRNTPVPMGPVQYSDNHKSFIRASLQNV